MVLQEDEKNDFCPGMPPAERERTKNKVERGRRFLDSNWSMVKSRKVHVQSSLENFVRTFYESGVFNKNFRTALAPCGEHSCGKFSSSRLRP